MELAITPRIPPTISSGPQEPPAGTFRSREEDSINVCQDNFKPLPFSPMTTDSKGAPPTLPRAITFDCWQTLLADTDLSRPREARAGALIACATAAGRPLSRAGALDILSRTWRRHHQAWQEENDTGAPEMARWSLEAIGIPGTEIHRHAPSLANAFAEANLLGQVRAIEGARETLKRLERAGVRCGLVCDTGFSPGRVVRQLLERVGLLEGLESLAFSDEVGAPKPDPRIFECALEGLGVAPRHALHIGDLRRTDVAGARALGMKTVRLCQPHDDRSGHPEADHVVESHTQFCKWLGLQEPV
ncbi:MAG: HAD family hydrolase [Myxococcota bacterium]